MQTIINYDTRLRQVRRFYVKNTNGEIHKSELTCGNTNENGRPQKVPIPNQQIIEASRERGSVLLKGTKADAKDGASPVVVKVTEGDVVLVQHSII